MRKICGVLFVLATFLWATPSVQATSLFDYQGYLSDTKTVDGITSTATTTGGTLAFNDGYGVDGNGWPEINNNETLNIEFSECVLVEGLRFTHSNGTNNDYVKMLVDGVEFDFSSDFGSSHPEEMFILTPSRVTNPADQVFDLDFTGIGVTGTNFTFLIPAEWQASGTLGSEYVLGSMTVALCPVPEPSTMLLLGAGLAGLAGVTWRRRKNG
ncbi:PEP-CTERM sorting domain-containing protein [Desulfuromonas sp. TF]|uniref:PEP-CTERM sorting domain-containing protein n=1 Tax=Desulfuromonas sp. TF TaxID=1232410 RepID=UPI000487E395|nr:PEP-CTERM sorting domain-containing protein [Desulfuromonas sp. TF]